MSTATNLSQIRNCLDWIGEHPFNQIKLEISVINELDDGEQIMLVLYREKANWGTYDYSLFIITNMRVVEYNTYGQVKIYDDDDYYFKHAWGMRELIRKDGGVLHEKLEFPRTPLSVIMLLDPLLEAIFEKR